MNGKPSNEKQKRRRGRRLTAILCCFSLLVCGLPASVFAAGGQGEDKAVPYTQGHSHDMSVECGNENPLDYIPLTGDADGNLYINGTKAEILQGPGSNFNYYTLPEGNYYLAEDITLKEHLDIPKNKTVNLCLNGRTLQLEEYIDVDGTFCVSDCGKGGKITCNNHILLWLQSDTHFILYNGCLELTSTAEDFEDTAYGRDVIYMTGISDTEDIKVDIYDGTIKSKEAEGIGGEGILMLSGTPKFIGNSCDIGYEVVLHLTELNMDAGKKIKIAADNASFLLPVGESILCDRIESLDGVDYTAFLETDIRGQYFTYEEGPYYVNMAGITKQPTQEKISVSVYPDEGAAYQWYETVEQDVTADRTIKNQSVGSYEVSMCTLQAGDTLFFTTQEELDDGTMVILIPTVSQDASNMVYMQSLGEGQYKGTIEVDDTYGIMAGSGFITLEEGAYKVVRTTYGDAVEGQVTNTLKKAPAGKYACEVKWDKTGYRVYSEIAEVKLGGYMNMLSVVTAVHMTHFMRRLPILLFRPVMNFWQQQRAVVIIFLPMILKWMGQIFRMTKMPCSKLKMIFGFA